MPFSVGNTDTEYTKHNHIVMLFSTKKNHKRICHLQCNSAYFNVQIAQHMNCKRLDRPLAEAVLDSLGS
jgi:hypothetical protein